MQTVVIELESPLNMHLCYEPNPTDKSVGAHFIQINEFGLLPVLNETYMINEHDQHIKG